MNFTLKFWVSLKKEFVNPIRFLQNNFGDFFSVSALIQKNITLKQNPGTRTSAKRRLYTRSAIRNQVTSTRALLWTSNTLAVVFATSKEMCSKSTESHREKRPRGPSIPPAKSYGSEGDMRSTFEKSRRPRQPI